MHLIPSKCILLPEGLKEAFSPVQWHQNVIGRKPGCSERKGVNDGLDCIDSSYKIVNENDWESELSQLHQFVDKSKNICLYGAGDAGEIFTEILRRRSKKVSAYIISDGQKIPEKKMSATIYNLSDYPGDWAETDVLITISSRYKKLPNFAEMVKNHGAQKVLMISNELFHAGISELI